VVGDNFVRLHVRTCRQDMAQVRGRNWSQ
jgi:hypothetical protein